MRTPRRAGSTYAVEKDSLDEPPRPTTRPAAIVRQAIKVRRGNQILLDRWKPKLQYCWLAEGGWWSEPDLRYDFNGSTKAGTVVCCRDRTESALI